MTGANNKTEIDLGELALHQRRLGAVLDRLTTAAGASREYVNPLAFGALGVALGSACAALQTEAIETLDFGVAATERHIRNVGRWKDDVDMNEFSAASMFREMINLD
jgi:hypothetical protein